MKAWIVAALVLLGVVTSGCGGGQGSLTAPPADPGVVQQEDKAVEDAEKAEAARQQQEAQAGGEQ